MEGNLRFEIDWASNFREVTLPFLLCFTLYLRAVFQVLAPPGSYIWRRHLTEGFCVTGLGGLYLEGLIFGILR